MKKILVVDDEKGVRLSLDRQLKRAGYKVLLAEGGQQALAVLKSENIDLVLLDHKMPNMDGLETFRAMKKHGLIDGTAAGMMTAYGSIPLVSAFMKDGGDFFVEKPFYPGVLEAILAREITIAETTRQKVEVQTLELNCLKDQAESASKLKSRILENIEHQTRTPLAVAMGYAEMLNDPKMPKNTRKLANPLYNALQAGYKILEDLWYISRLQSEVEITIEVVSLAECIDAVNYRKIAQEKGLALKIDVSDMEVKADKKALTRVLDCLLDNAIKFTPEHGDVTIKAQENDNIVMISVQDSGIGIQAERIEGIFDIFYKVDESGFQTGTGVGLPIAKTLVEAMGGRIGVESEIGKGSTFYFSLPKTKGDQKVIVKKVIL
jgi:signal transduction histidine kinase